MTTSHHFGPSTSEVGGMASVIRTFGSHAIGASKVRTYATWFRASTLRTVTATLGALTIIARIPHGDTVHVHLSEGGSFLREGALVLAARRRSLRIVAHLHGADFAATAAAHPAVVGRVLRAATHVSCLSPEALGIARTLAPDTHTRLIPNPVELDAVPSRAHETLPIVLFAGEIGRRKGVDVLAAAWPRVLEQVPDALLFVVGPKGDMDMPQLPRVTVLPPCDSTAIRTLIRAARVVALPSRAEAMPMVLLEAQATARPYVATPVGGVEALTKAGGGTLVPVGDTEALADALVVFLTDVERADDTGRAGRASCRNTRSPGVVSRTYEEFLATYAA